MLAQLGDVDIHRTGIEVVVVNPYGLQRIVAWEQFVGLAAEQVKEFGFLGGELCLLTIDGEHLLLCVEFVHADSVYNLFPDLSLALHSAKDGFDAEHHFFHREWLGYVVVCTEFKALLHVVFHGLCREEHKRNIGIDFTNLVGQRKSIHPWHHYVENTEVEMGLYECVETFFAVNTEHSAETLCLEVFPE